VVSIKKKKLLYLMHPDKENVFSGYGLPLENRYHLVGLLMIDRPYRANDDWLARVKDEFGDFLLAYMTRSGERGIACQMKIDKDSKKFLREIDHPLNDKLAKKLYPLLENRPNPKFRMLWDDQSRGWVSEFDLESQEISEYRKKSKY
jgi:nuclear transport factor 2 (NTF2) superfamily protein